LRNQKGHVFFIFISKRIKAIRTEYQDVVKILKQGNHIT